MLTARVGLHDRVTFRQGSALGMPFAEGTFDVVWTQDVLMNIVEKPRLFTEMIGPRPGGHLAFQANLAGQVLGVSYPTFWADEDAAQFSPPSRGVPTPPGRKWFPGARVVRHDRASCRTGTHPPGLGVGEGPSRRWSTDPRRLSR